MLPMKYTAVAIYWSTKVAVLTNFDNRLHTHRWCGMRTLPCFLAHLTDYPRGMTCTGMCYRLKTPYPSGPVVENPDVSDESGGKKTVADERLQLLREALGRQAPAVTLLLQIPKKSFCPRHLHMKYHRGGA